MKEICKNYKPEILTCPKCQAKLVYKHSVSSKYVYFTNGKRIKIRNLGYGCPSCNDRQIYFSQTANKFAFKGYTYSAKIVCTVAKLKENNVSRDHICDYFFGKNIDISDRNVDNLYHLYLKLTSYDVEDRIDKAIKQMEQNFKQIRFSIDLITVEKLYYIIVYDFFTGELLALKVFESLDAPEIKTFLSSFLKPDLNITYLTTIRKDLVFVPLLRSLCPKSTKFISFNKF